MATKQSREMQDTLAQTIDMMKKAGANYAESSCSLSEDRGVSVRLGDVETQTASTSIKITMMMRIGDKSESVSVCSRSLQDLSNAVRQLAAVLPLKPDYEFDRPVDRSLLAKMRNNRSLDLVDRSAMSVGEMIAQAKTAEDAARAMPKIVNSEGATFTRGRSLSLSLTSDGDLFTSERTYNSVGVSVIAKDGKEQQVSGESSIAVFREDLVSAARVGEIAALDAARSLKARKVKQGRFPVVLHPDIGAGLLGHFADAISGGNVRKKSSFLAEAMDKAVFANGLYVVDNPGLKRGRASTNYTSDGLPAHKRVLVEDGVLKGWIIGVENARRLGVDLSKIGGKTNLTIEPGPVAPDDLIADIKNGLYVTGLMGQGVNITSGEYSRAAKGFWIKNGKIDYDHPVDNVSVSSNLREMFLGMSAANDINRLRSRTAVPTLRIASMSVG